MTFLRATLFPLPIILAALAVSTTAQAQTFTFVSSSGNDTNSCTTPAAACATMFGAQTKMSEGGTITCANPGIYGAFVITKSLTIDCQAGGGGSDTQLVIINAPGKTVRLRNLVVNGGGSGSGLEILAAANVHLENVYVTGSNSVGIYDHRVGPAYLVIHNSSIVGNPGAGIVVAPNGGNLAVVLDNVRSTNNTYGLGVGAGGRVMIKRSVFSANSVAGIQADTGSSVGINETLISHNSVGITALNGSSLVLSNSDIDSNNTPINGLWFSHGNNRIFANLSSGTAPTATGAATSDLGQR